MTLNTVGLIQTELEARGVPALLELFRKRGYIVIHCEWGAKLEFTDVDPTLSCQVIEANGAVIENIESDIPSDTADVKLVADWITSTYSEALAAQGRATNTGIIYHQLEVEPESFGLARGAREVTLAQVVAAVDAYDAKINAAERAPDGDDYNKLHAIVTGGEVSHMKIKFDLTIDVQPDSVAFELKWPESAVLSGVSFMGSGTDDPLGDVVRSVAEQIKTIVKDRPLAQPIEAVRGKYADVPTSVDEFLERKWEDTDR